MEGSTKKMSCSHGSGVKNEMEKGNKLFDVQFEDAFMCAGTSYNSDPRVATVVSGKFDHTRLFYVAVNTCACVCVCE